MIYILTDSDWESTTILNVVEGPDGFDIPAAEQEFYKNNPKADGKGFLKFLIKSRDFRFVDYHETELANRYISPEPRSTGPWSKIVSKTLDDFRVREAESLAKQRQLLDSLMKSGSVHYVTVHPTLTQKGDPKMAKKPAMPKSGKAKPKGGKCK